MDNSRFWRIFGETVRSSFRGIPGFVRNHIPNRELRMFNVLRKFETMRPFTESEAWLLFRIAAVAEACGWTLLITGILLNPYVSPHTDTVLILAGRTHGMLFFVYCLASLGLYPSLGWPRRRAVFALAFSVPPYGTLLFERWASARRHSGGFKTYRDFLRYNVLVATA